MTTRTEAVLAVALGLVLGVAPVTAATAAPDAPPSPGRPAPDIPLDILPAPGQLKPGQLTTGPAPKLEGLQAGPYSAVLAAVRKRTAEVEHLGELVSQQDTELAGVRTVLASRTSQLALAEQELADRQRVADAWARRAYMSARRLPDPLRPGPMLPESLAAGPVDSGQLERAKSAMQAARAAYEEAAATERSLATRWAQAHARFTAASQALAELRARHADELAAGQALLDVRRQQAGDKYLAELGVQGGAAGPAALRALAYALAQRGKPYVWGAEGPDTFDCSGLVQAAYASAGIRLPRTARPQWRATPGVPTTAMVPGDLLFFATDASNWDTIHHVGIYLGAGKMIHAPQSGDVVRVAPVWWEEFFGATRVVPTVAGPQVLPLVKPLKPAPKPPKPGPAPTPTPPPKSPSPSTSPPPGPSGPPSPSTPPPTSPSPSTSPSGQGPTLVDPSLLNPLLDPSRLILITPRAWTG